MTHLTEHRVMSRVVHRQNQPFLGKPAMGHMTAFTDYLIGLNPYITAIPGNLFCGFEGSFVNWVVPLLGTAQPDADVPAMLGAHPSADQLAAIEQANRDQAGLKGLGILGAVGLEHAYELLLVFGKLGNGLARLAELG